MATNNSLNNKINGVTISGTPAADQPLVATSSTAAAYSYTNPAKMRIASQAAGDVLYADTTTTWARLAKGSDTQVLTLASGVPTWAAAGGGSSTPNFGFSTLFESSGRFVSESSSTASAANTYSTQGVTVSSGTNSAGYQAWKVRNNTGFNVFDGSHTAWFHAQVPFNGSSINQDTCKVVGDPALAASGITFTDKHIGWKHVQAGSASRTSSYTVADGTTETAATYTDAEASGQEYFHQKNSTTNVKFYYQGALQGTVTTNIPTGSSSYWMKIAQSNKNSNNTDAGFLTFFAGYYHDAF